MSEPDYVTVVRSIVRAIPAGKVLSYGDVAELAELRSARQVGQVMARHGDGLPWHRVILASGAPATHKALEQLAMLRADGTPMSDDGSRVDMRRARWDGRSGMS